MTVRNKLEQMVNFNEELEVMARARDQLKPYLAGEDDGSAAYHKLKELEELFTANIESMAETQSQLCNAMEELENPTQRIILKYRYFLGMNWEEIAENLHLERRWVFRQHRKALEELEKIMNGIDH